MKGIVLETKNEYAAVLKEDGTVVKIRRNCAVGETIEITKKMEASTDRGRMIRVVRAAVIAAAALLLVFGTGGYYFTATAAATVTIYSDDGNLTLSLNRLDRVIRVEASGNVREEDVKALYDEGIKNSTLPEALEKVSGVLKEKTVSFPIDIETGSKEKYETFKVQAEEKGFQISGNQNPETDLPQESEPLSEQPQGGNAFHAEIQEPEQLREESQGDETLHQEPQESEPLSEQPQGGNAFHTEMQEPEPLREESQGDETLHAEMQEPEPFREQPQGNETYRTETQTVEPFPQEQEPADASRGNEIPPEGRNNANPSAGQGINIW